MSLPIPRFAYPVGTKVRLASGGPEMQVLEADPANGTNYVVWDEGKQEGTFFAVCLDIVRAHHIIGTEDLL